MHIHYVIYCKCIINKRFVPLASDQILLKRKTAKGYGSGMLVAVGNRADGTHLQKSLQPLKHCLPKFQAYGPSPNLNAFSGVCYRSKRG